MLFLQKSKLMMLSTCLTFVLIGCSGMSAQDKSTATGAGVGAIGGAVLTGGSPAGTIGGAAIGGYIGHEVEKSK